MSLNHSSIVQATIQSSRVFNRYSYRTEDTIAEVQQPGYFLKCQFAVSDGPGSNGAANFQPDDYPGRRPSANYGME